MKPKEVHSRVKGSLQSIGVSGANFVQNIFYSCDFIAISERSIRAADLMEAVIIIE